MTKKSKFYNVDEVFPNLNEDIDRNNHLFKIKNSIDFDFIRKLTEPYYSAKTGRPKYDAVMMFKILLLSILYNLSIRKISQMIGQNVLFVWFLDLKVTRFDKPLINHSTISKHMKIFTNADIFEKIFHQILLIAQEHNLIGLYDVYMDSTHIRANANKNKFRNELQIVKDSFFEEKRLNDVNEERKKINKKAFSKKKKIKYKNVKVSTTDPESAFMTRDGKPQGFFYLDHRVVDGRYNLILDTIITPGNVNDSQYCIPALNNINRRLGLTPKIIGLDSGYFTGVLLNSLYERNIIVSVPYKRPFHSQNEFKKRDFIYVKEENVYKCPNNQILKFTTIDRDGYKIYTSDKKICATCPLRESCTKSKSMQKIITRSIYQEDVDTANAFRLTEMGKKYKKKRSQTIERSFADSKRQHGYEYTRYIGQKKVQAMALLTAITMNLKIMAGIIYERDKKSSLRGLG